MRRTLTAIGLCVALAGCHLEQRPEQAEREKADRAQQADKDRRLKEAEETLRRHTIELGLLWSRTSCNNDTVKEFLRTCEQEETGCTQTDVGNSFSAFLESQERVRAYLKPDLGIESLVRLRQTQLQELVEQQYLHVGTQFIILLLPRSYSQGHQEEAERIGQQVVQYMRETLKLQFRAEFFNVLNHTNLNNPGTTVSSGGFGRITGAGAPRIIQMALKLRF